MTNFERLAESKEKLAAFFVDMAEELRCEDCPLLDFCKRTEPEEGKFRCETTVENWLKEEADV